MYLKNIEVYGFKSFAQKINFEFHNGITGIVGPNGSGKSNVGDAVRWVLGEQSAKQLRGGNMQDVIFSGTENRKPLSFASVSITLDNSDHKLPVDYNEVTVARRLYRSGESEYLINGSGCRLKDIQEMFYDTGIGKEGYSIIGQGQIDKILSGKPEERRELFDEAAGIVKFKRRKITTLKKLDEERQNLVRVTDILSELTKQLGPLERQSETARIYLAKRDELKELDINLFLLDHQRTGELLNELETKLSQAQQELDEAQSAYEQTKAEYERLEQELEELNTKLDALKEEQQENALLKQQYEGQVKVLEDGICVAVHCYAALIHIMQTANFSAHAVDVGIAAFTGVIIANHCVPKLIRVQRIAGFVVQQAHPRVVRHLNRFAVFLPVELYRRTGYHVGDQVDTSADRRYL